MLVTWIALVLRDRYLCNNMLVDYLHCVKEVSLTLDDLAFEAGLVMRFSCDSYPTSLTSTTSVSIHIHISISISIYPFITDLDNQRVHHLGHDVKKVAGGGLFGGGQAKHGRYPLRQCSHGTRLVLFVQHHRQHL